MLFNLVGVDRIHSTMSIAMVYWLGSQKTHNCFQLYPNNIRQHLDVILAVKTSCTAPYVFQDAHDAGDVNDLSSRDIRDTLQPQGLYHCPSAVNHGPLDRINVGGR